MAKAAAQYICQACGAVQSKWAGRCEDCGGWNTVSEQSVSLVPKGLKPGKAAELDWQSLTEAHPTPQRYASGIAELDRVLGGGWVEGGAVLLAGDPGIGKSTLLLQAVVSSAAQGLRVAYVSGEESAAQVALRGQRLGMRHERVMLAAETSVRNILAALDGAQPPQLVILDSIQTLFVDSLDAAPGTVTQVRASAQELIRLGKRKGIALVFVGHVTKDGQIAGPRVLEHMVDAVLSFEGERGYPFRILRAVKNRYGGTDEIGVFEMKDSGLKEVVNPSALFLADRTVPVSGAAVFAGIEGSRPLLVEVQALVAPSGMSTPRRAVVGWDANRLAMILAVLETRAGCRFADKEVYLNVAGGIRINEPAADVAVAAALVSALINVPLAAGSGWFGEIGLSGEVRRVSRADARLKEMEKLGFTAAYAPRGDALKGLSLRVHALETVHALVKQIGVGH